MKEGFSGVLGKLYEDGEVIIRPGDVGDCMYVVQLGKVEVIQRKGEKEFCLAVLGEGDFFGEMALFGQGRHTATVRALGGASILTLEKKSFLRSMHYDPSLAFSIMKKMADRIQELEALLVRYGELA